VSFASIPKERRARRDGMCKRMGCYKQFKAGDMIVWGYPTKHRPKEKPIGPFCSRECHDLVEELIDRSPD